MALAAWPGLLVDAETYGRRLAGCLPPGTDPLAALARLHASDVYLTCGCALGLAEAQQCLDRAHLSLIGSYLATMRPTAAFVDEVHAAALERLLVRGDRPRPRIAEYDGRVALGAWLRVIIARVAANLRSRKAPWQLRDEDAVPAGIDLELDHLRAHYGPAFSEALRAAIAALSPADRGVLLLRYTDGLTVEQIGRLQSVHKSTISRQLTQIRAELRSRARELLAERLGLRGDDLDSLVRALGSRLGASLTGLLRR